MATLLYLSKLVSELSVLPLEIDPDNQDIQEINYLTKQFYRSFDQPPGCNIC